MDNSQRSIVLEVAHNWAAYNEANNTATISHRPHVCAEFLITGKSWPELEQKALDSFTDSLSDQEYDAVEKEREAIGRLLRRGKMAEARPRREALKNRILDHYEADLAKELKKRRLGKTAAVRSAIIHAYLQVEVEKAIRYLESA